MTITPAQHIITWQRAHGRHDLPWQNTTDAYRVWLSEVMLQQTQVVTVMDYYTRFLNRFPAVADLAHASQDEVLALWTGLGYYSRARNLHACAMDVVSRFGGEFPASVDDLMTLKGIGASTAAAISVFAFGRPAAILDGNVKRIIARVHGIDAPASGSTDKILWQHAREWLATETDAKKLGMPHEAALRIYTQGLMDFGATLCTRRKPSCEVCPMSSDCMAFKNDATDLIPAAKVRVKSIELDVPLFIYVVGNKVWLEKRPAKGIWAGLYSFPEKSLLDLSETNINPQSISPQRHVLTHRVLHLQPTLLPLTQAQANRFDDLPHAGVSGWFGLDELSTVGLPKPIAVLAKAAVAERLT